LIGEGEAAKVKQRPHQSFEEREGECCEEGGTRWEGEKKVCMMSSKRGGRSR